MKRAAALVLLLAVARADVETALYFVDRARTALEQGDLEKADHWIERALKEETNFAPALLAAADLAERRGRRPEVLRHLAACVERGKEKGLTDREYDAVKAARTRLRKLDAARFELDAILDRYAADMVALGDRSAKSDPELAREFWRHALLARPDHVEAKARLGGPAGPAPAGERLFNGVDLEGWTGEDPAWTVRDGVLVGEITGNANVSRHEREVRGDFALVCQMRVREDIGDEPVFGLLFGMRGSYDHFGMWIWDDGWRLDHQTGEKERDELHRRAVKNHKEKYDRFAWNTYRIEVAGKRITGFVNGKKIWSTAGAVRPLDGFVGLWVQDQRVEIRHLVVDVR